MKSRILVIACITILLALIHRHTKQYHARHSYSKITGPAAGSESFRAVFSLPGIHLLLSQL